MRRVSSTSKIERQCPCPCGRVVKIRADRSKNFTLSEDNMVYMVAHDEVNWKAVVNAMIDEYRKKNSPDMMDEFKCTNPECKGEATEITGETEFYFSAKCKVCGLDKLLDKKKVESVVKKGMDIGVTTTTQ